MLKRFIEVTLVLSLVFAAQTAQAFFDPPWITPAAPRAGEIVSVNIHGGICDGVVFRPGYPQLTQEGSSVRLLEYGVHVDFEDFCIYGVGTVSEPIGAFPPGDYTLTVDFLYDDFLYGPTIINLGVIPFTVSGAAFAEPVPASSVATLLALLLLVSSLALWSLRIRRRSRC